MANAKATLTINDSTYDLNVYKGSLGYEAVDIRPLTQNKLFAYDPGLVSTAVCESEITYVDGDNGQLLYRGYPIDQLAENGDYLEISYLLLFGERPTKEQYQDFCQ